MGRTPEAKPQRRKVFLHIGLHKTGTTAIQHFLENNKKPLQQHGLSYPGYYFGYAMRLGYPDWAAHVARLRPILAAIPEDNIILSDEDLSACPAHIGAILAALDGFELKIICYVRRQDAWLQSFYAQCVAWPDNYTGTFEDWMREHGAALADYHARLKPWADAVGAGNFTLRVYEKKAARHWLIEDFLGCIGITEHAAFDFSTDPQAQNRSLDRDCLEVKRLVNRTGLDMEQGKRITDLLQQFSRQRAKGRPGGLTFLSPRQRLEIIARYAESNQRLARDFLGRQDGALFTAPLPDAGADFAPYPGLDPENAYALMAELIKALSER